MIENYLNVRNSTRNLSDEEFDEILPQLANELRDICFYTKYSDDILYDSWEKLCKYNGEKISPSTVIVGMKLCQHFFDNFYDIKNIKGDSFRLLWNNTENLKKILTWNRKSHSTPYLSELKRGIYFCCGLTKNTMFRPHLAKTICMEKVAVENCVVLDPCAGWGGRMLGVSATGNKYIGFEPCKETYDNLQKLKSFLNLNNVTLYNDLAENMKEYDFENVDIILTSPPYFNLEIYSDRGCETKYSNYYEWMIKWLSPIIKMSLDRLKIDGWSCWNVHNMGKISMIDHVRYIHEQLGYEKKDCFGIESGKRPTNNDSRKNLDITNVFMRKGDR